MWLALVLMLNNNNAVATVVVNVFHYFYVYNSYYTHSIEKATRMISSNLSPIAKSFNAAFPYIYKLAPRTNAYHSSARPSQSGFQDPVCPAQQYHQR